LKNLVKDVIGRENLPESISFRIVPGEAVSVITNMAKTFKPNYIFMGTRDKYDLMDRWIGTVSLGVVKSCNYPTYLIPKHSKYDSINKALVATDSHMKNPKLIHWLKIWNKKYNSFIKFLYVQRSEKRELEAISEGIISNLFEEDDVEFSFEIENVKSKDLVEALLAQAYNLGADLIIAAPDRQSLVQSILYKSVSKELILKSKIPLLFLKFYYRD
jgi:nucleotide-binding universal stress UspA family protein